MSAWPPRACSRANTSSTRATWMRDCWPAADGDHDLSLEGPVRGVSSRVGPGYELRHFTIDWDGERVTCPRGKTSVTWRTIRAADGGPRIQALFSRTDCRVCPARALCTPATSTRCHVHFHPRADYEALNAARARMADPAWVERYRRRAGVEGTLSQGVRAFGLRRSRLHRPGQDWPPAGLHGSGDQRLTGGALAER